MAKLSFTILDNWINSNPNFHFYTSLPHVADHFVTGDHPVVVMVQNENMVWQPRDDPQQVIGKLDEILKNPRYAFHVPLTPYGRFASTEKTAGVLYRHAELIR